MRVIPRIIFAAGLLVLMVSASGCAGYNRSADEWLTLSISGLAGTDAYTYSGQTVTTLPSGASYSQRKFSGEVVDHALAKQQEEEGSDVSPAQLLNSLQKVSKAVTFGPQPENQSQLLLKVEVSPDDAKKIWSDYLTQQMEQIALSAPSNDAPYKKEWDTELNNARKSLNEQLNSLKVDSAYEVLVDRDRMLPVMLHETSQASYVKNGKEVGEKRSTDITLDSFSSVNSKSKNGKPISTGK